MYSKLGLRHESAVTHWTSDGLRDEAFLARLRKDELLFHLPTRFQVEVVVVDSHFLDQFFVLFKHETDFAQMLQNIVIDRSFLVIVI